MRSEVPLSPTKTHHMYLSKILINICNQLKKAGYGLDLRFVTEFFFLLFIQHIVDSMAVCFQNKFGLCQCQIVETST